MARHEQTCTRSAPRVEEIVFSWSGAPGRTNSARAIRRASRRDKLRLAQPQVDDCHRPDESETRRKW